MHVHECLQQNPIRKNLRSNTFISKLGKLLDNPQITPDGSVGCYREDAEGMTMQGRTMIVSDAVCIDREFSVAKDIIRPTALACAFACRQLRFYGLGTAGCVCSNEYGRYGPADAGECSMVNGTFRGVNDRSVAVYRLRCVPCVVW